MMISQIRAFKWSAALKLHGIHRESPAHCSSLNGKQHTWQWATQAMYSVSSLDHPGYIAVHMQPFKTLNVVRKQKIMLFDIADCYVNSATAKNVCAQHVMAFPHTPRSTKFSGIK